VVTGVGAPSDAFPLPARFSPSPSPTKVCVLGPALWVDVFFGASPARRPFPPRRSAVPSPFPLLLFRVVLDEFRALLSVFLSFNVNPHWKVPAVDVSFFFDSSLDLGGLAGCAVISPFSRPTPDFSGLRPRFLQQSRFILAS